MDSRLSPAKVFYPLALIVFGAMFLFPNPLLPLVAFYCLLVGAIWSYSTQVLQVDDPKLTQLAPPIFLLLFMGVLTQALNRPTTETLFHTIRGLIMFRSLTYILIQVRMSPNPFPKPLVVLVGGIALEMLFVMVRVYHLIYPLQAPPAILNVLEVKLLALIVAALMLYAYLQKSRSRQNHS